MRIDTELLREQHKFLADYPWREEHMPEEVIGVLNLIESLLEGEDD
jgi:hypothetical protein